MKAIKIEKENEIEIMTGVQEWEWQAETGDLYYRRDGKLHHEKCKSVEQLNVTVNAGR